MEWPPSGALSPEAGTALAEPARTRVAQMFYEHYDFIWRLLRRIGVEPESVDDAAQEAFLIAMRKIGEIAPGCERSYLFGTALRIAADRRKALRHRSEHATEAAGSLACEQLDPEQLVDRTRARKRLDDILDQMDDELRTVLMLFELEGMTTREIASLLGIPAGTAASRLRRAREEFQVVLRRSDAHRGGRP